MLLSLNAITLLAQATQAQATKASNSQVQEPAHASEALAAAQPTVLLPPAISASGAASVQAAAESQFDPQPQTGPAREDTHGSIKVHGHWLVDVLNADGSVADHRDYQNSLYPEQGENALLYLLTGQVVPSAFGAFLENGFGVEFTVFPYNTTYTDGACKAPYAYCFLNETQNYVGPPPYNLTLQGTITEPNFEGPDSDYYSGTVIVGCTDQNLQGYVKTITSANVTDQNPLACSGYSDGQPLPANVVGVDLALTLHTLSPALVVTPGQHVQLTVAISLN
jgi:hypothetical protein